MKSYKKEPAFEGLMTQEEAPFNERLVDAVSVAPPSEGGLPRYRTIYEELLARIRSGAYPVGSLLPPELQLCRHYNASRYTVREAVRLLSESGMVSRRPGVGTRVETTRATTRYTQQISKLEDLFQYISHATLQVLSVSLMRIGVRRAQLLQSDANSKWLHIIAVKLLEGESAPVAHSEVYVHPEYSAVGSDVGKVKLPLSLLIERRFSKRIIEVRQEFSATPISGETAKKLKLRSGTPGLVITRRYYGEKDALMLLTITTFPYKKMKYSMSLTFDAPAR
ncbi:GntR family transcriptional regulator [Pollutimonas bauzanensis]|uniref:DNA-binding transcriptional regulator, GntR family n=1 Tax=Pollutimonas bauzanensis TaxID=658167 RepID=A0A1M6AHA3_9BURK|nr:GntR family transcriptional regulator [Pollutimonas bauzanensis]SHI35845.1 DNA-binding transcriptional regulator, GntR family [Pollutimonas bauzanensis]